MNFFQQELKRIFDYDTDNLRLVGRACIIPMTGGNVAKAEFITCGMADRYEALRIKIINANQGETDQLMLRFSDYCAKRPNVCGLNTPYIWLDNGKAEWYIPPTNKEMQSISDAACDYIGTFENAINEGMTMS